MAELLLHPLSVVMGHGSLHLIGSLFTRLTEALHGGGARTDIFIMKSYVEVNKNGYKLDKI